MNSQQASVGRKTERNRISHAKAKAAKAAHREAKAIAAAEVHAKEEALAKCRALKAERWAQATAAHPDDIVARKAAFHQLHLEYVRECSRKGNARIAEERERAAEEERKLFELEIAQDRMRLEAEEAAERLRDQLEEDRRRDLQEEEDANYLEYRRYIKRR